MRFWKLSATASAFVTAALIVVACAPAATPTTVPVKLPAAAPVVATKPAEAPKPADAPKLADAPKPAEATKPAEAAKPTEAAKPVDAAKPATAVKPGSTKLSFLGVQSPTNQAAWNAILKEYQKTNPNIDIEWDLVPFAQVFPKVSATVAAKTPVDIIQADGPVVWFYAYNKAILPLDEYFPKDYVEKNFAPTSLATSAYRGKFYAPPMSESCSTMWFNQEMVDAAGIKPPRELAQSWNMDDALAAWQKTNNPPQVYGLRWGQGTFLGDYEYGIFRRSAGAKGSITYKGVQDDGVTVTGSFDSPEAIMAHQFVRDLFQKSKVSAVEPIPDAFLNKRAAFYVAPDGVIGQIKRQYPDNSFKYGATGTPFFKGGTQLCHTDSFHYSVGAYSANQKAAAEFIKFASGPEGSKIYYANTQALPAHLSLLGTLPEYTTYPQSLTLEVFRAAGIPRIQTPGYNEYQQMFSEFVQNIATGQNVDVPELAKATAKRMDGAMGRYKGWNTQ